MSKNNPGASIVAGLIPVGSAGVEIGVWDGDSSEEFLERAGHVYLVDPWPKRDEQYDYVVRRFKHARATIHRMTSEKFFKWFADKVDWVYIDGAHDYLHVLADLYGAENILKADGVIYGDDYGKKEGVKEAVDEFCRVRGRNLELLGLSQYAIT